MQLKEQKWFPLFSANFLGVFNDNFLKNGIIFVAMAWSIPGWLSQSQLIALVGACLVAPYLLFSPIGGSWAVRYSKLKVFRVLKLLELPIMGIACIAFYYQWIALAVVALLLLGTQSSLYSPSKYSLIRDIGGSQGVSYGSGMFETMAFLGILLGTFVASVVSDFYSFGLFAAIVLGVALLGYQAAAAIRAVELPETNDDSGTFNPVLFVKKNYLAAKKHRLVNSAVFGSSVFWLITNMMQMTTIIHCKNVYGVSNSVTGLVMAVAAVGIAVGTSLVGRFSGGTVRKELIIPTALCMVICLVIIVALPLTFAGFLVVIALFALVAGMFQVPCMAMVQQADLKRKRGDTIAYLNVMNFVFLLLGTVLFSVITAWTGENSFVVFATMTLICLGVLAYFLLKYPDFRWATQRAFYKIRN